MLFVAYLFLVIVPRQSVAQSLLYPVFRDPLERATKPYGQSEKRLMLTVYMQMSTSKKPNRYLMTELIPTLKQLTRSGFRPCLPFRSVPPVRPHPSPLILSHSRVRHGTITSTHQGSIHMILFSAPRAFSLVTGLWESWLSVSLYMESEVCKICFALEPLGGTTNTTKIKNKSST